MSILQETQVDTPQSWKMNISRKIRVSTLHPHFVKWDTFPCKRVNLYWCNISRIFYVIIYNVLFEKLCLLWNVNLSSSPPRFYPSNKIVHEMKFRTLREGTNRPPWNREGRLNLTPTVMFMEILYFYASLKTCGMLHSMKSNEVVTNPF